MPSRKFDPASFLASLLGVGFIPGAPGTYGSIFAAAVYLLLPAALFMPANWPLYWLGLAFLVSAAVLVSGQAERKLGHDAPQIVIDEAAGYFLAVALLPHSLAVAAYALVLFRAFDIIKPWPVNVSQRLRAGWGIVADDLLAGVYANIIIQIMLRLTPKFFGQ